MPRCRITESDRRDLLTQADTLGQLPLLNRLLNDGKSADEIRSAMIQAVTGHTTKRLADVSDDELVDSIASPRLV